MFSGLGKRIQVYTQKGYLNTNGIKKWIDNRKNNVIAEIFNDWLLQTVQLIQRKIAQNNLDNIEITLEDIKAIVQNEVSEIKQENTSHNIDQYISRFLEEHKTTEGYSKKRRTF